MNKFCKNLVMVTTLCLALLLMCLGFIKYEVFANCVISMNKDDTYLTITDNDYSQLQNKSNPKIKINNQDKNLQVIKNWNHDPTTKIWTAQIVSGSNLVTGNFKLYLKSTSIFNLN